MNFDSGGQFSIQTPSGVCGNGNITISPGNGVRFDFNDRRFGPNIQTVISTTNCLTTRSAAPNIPYKYCFGWSPKGFKLGVNSIIKTIQYTPGFSNPITFIPPSFATIKSIKTYDRVFEDSILRQLALAGVTQIGWLNNGAGIVHPVTYYNANENA